jgi:ribose transport system ATP-binding protein
VIDRLRRRGLAIVYISHFLAEIRRVATTVTILRDGRAVARGPLSGFGDDDLVRQMAGRELGELYPERRRASGAIVLEARDLAGAPLPHRASFVLRAGEILGIGGLCGSGRSELLETLFGLRPVRAGGIAFRGGPPPRTIAARWAQHCGLLVEDRQQVGLAAQRPLWANLVLPSARALRRGPVLRPWAARAAAGHWVLELGVRCRDADQRVALLSGGNQQKVALARLLQAGADLLLLDEPTRGIDVQSRQQIYAVLAARAAAGASILLVSSQLPELLGLCDRIAVMQGGVLGPARPAADWTQESLLQAALGGGGAP